MLQPKLNSPVSIFREYTNNLLTTIHVQGFVRTHPLKKERVRGKAYLTRDEARADIFDYIEVFYNRRCRHSKLGMTSPTESGRLSVGV
jgi:transposase InsO family protein